MNFDSTICAISTAPGTGAVAMIRISGNDAIHIIEKIFVPISKKNSLNPNNTGSIHLGKIIFKDKILDEVLLTLFLAPHSYTGENVIEISCHGSTFIQQQILIAIIHSGAKLADPGEFTLRAFMNGKMDLSQAEAVADLISSESESAHTIAMNQMRGGFSKEIAFLREQLLNFSSLIELELDFSEEDVEFANRASLKDLIEQIKFKIIKLIDSFAIGNVIKNGVPVTIVGRPNVGKSTLLNLLLKEEKAIVSEIPGTTRDVIEDVIFIQGVRFRFIDTAGIRHTNDTIEILGINRTFAKIEQTKIIILLLDPQQDFTDIERQINEIKPTKDQHLILVVNKIDLTDSNPKIIAKTILDYPVIHISAKKNLNLDLLIAQLISSIHLDNFNQSSVVISNVRHYQALTCALEGIVRVGEGLENNLQSDFIAMDIRSILHYLGEITGEITTNEILGNIFSKFCIGK